MSKSTHMESTLQVRSALLALQKELLNHLLETFEKENGRAVPPAEWLQMIMMAQRYAWLREMTSLIADVDMLTELQEISQEQAGVVRSEVERLIFNPELVSEFGKNYKQALMSGGPLLLPHGNLRAELQKLPKHSHSAEHGQADRKKWHELHKAQSRQRRS